jgi:hypothetical protein
MKKAIFSDPFAPVETQPVKVAGQTIASRIAVRVKDDDGNYQVQGILGKDYQLLPNRKVRDIAEDIMSRAPDNLGGFEPLKTLWDGKHYVDYFASRNPISTTNGQHSPLQLKCGLMVWNSYDGTRKVGFEVFALNPVCTNQYHSRNRFGFFAWRHDPDEAGKIDVDEALQNISVGVGNIIKVAPVIQTLKEKPLDLKLLQDAKRQTTLPKTIWGEVLDQLAGEEANAFGLFQAMTHITSHELTGLSALAAGTSVTEYFLNPPADRPIFNHTSAEQVIQTAG